MSEGRATLITRFERPRTEARSSSVIFPRAKPTAITKKSANICTSTGMIVIITNYRN